MIEIIIASSFYPGKCPTFVWVLWYDSQSPSDKLPSLIFSSVFMHRTEKL